MPHARQAATTSAKVRLEARVMDRRHLRVILEHLRETLEDNANLGPHRIGHHKILRHRGLEKSILWKLDGIHR